MSLSVRVGTGVQESERVNKDTLKRVGNGSPCEWSREARAIHGGEIRKHIRGNGERNRFKELGID